MVEGIEIKNEECKIEMWILISCRRDPTVASVIR